MEKNVFQGFSAQELKSLSMVNGGVSYRGTFIGASQTDEEAVTAAHETDPWSGDSFPYDSIDARWDNCSGITTNPGGVTPIPAHPGGR